MSKAQELFRSGALQPCLAALQDEVRAHPADAKLRVFLAQVLMVTGDWSRALNQLEVVGELDAAALGMKHTYATAIQCESLRKAVFAGERRPLVLGEPPLWIAGFLQALACDAQGQAQQAADLRAASLEDAPTSAGTLNGTPFEWVADADSRLGPILEAFVNGAYYWVPFERIRSVVFEAPADVRDLVWLPATFTWRNEGQAMGLIPVRYPGSEASSDDTLRLARRTEWRELGSDNFAGLGQRVLTTSDAELGLLEARNLALEGE